MLTVRLAKDRGHANHGWLDSYHTFSFADYHDSKHMNFRHLRVINEDRVEGGEGFGTHPHRDMEIITYVVEGAIEHKDSMGNGSVINAGDVQVMSAGTGVTHSEYNHFQDKVGHFLQIWILPRKSGLPPAYGQMSAKGAKENQLNLIVSGEKKEGSLVINQDAKLFNLKLISGKTTEYTQAKSRYGWVQMIAGEMQVNGTILRAGDGCAIENESALSFKATKDSHLLFFDLA